MIFTFLVVAFPVLGFTVIVTVQVPLPTIFTVVPETLQTFFEDDELTDVLAPFGTVTAAAFNKVDDTTLLPTFDVTTPLEVDEDDELFEVEVDEDDEPLGAGELLGELFDPEFGTFSLGGDTGAALVVTAIRADDRAFPLFAIT